MKPIVNIIKEEISEFNKTTFSDVPDDIYVHLRQRQFSDVANKSHMKVFRTKDSRDFLVKKTINQDVFKVYDFSNLQEPIAIAVFDVHNDYFTGYEHRQSINVNSKYRRIGIASAITDFAENIYNLPYKPTNLQSTEMQGFTKSRFTDKDTDDTELQEEIGAYKKALKDFEKGGRDTDVIQSEFNENFWKWFGDSKVTNDNGSPKLMYHGTTSDFGTFEKGEFGFHFGTYEQAKDILLNKRGEYTQASPTLDAFGNKKFERTFGKGSSMMPVYLSIKNPIEIQDAGEDEPDKILMGIESHIPQKDATYLWGLIPSPGYREDDRTLQHAREEIIRILLENGYDGLKYENEYEGIYNSVDHESWIAFKPQQIKSATGNNGEFSNSPDITKESVASKAAERMFNISNTSAQMDLKARGELQKEQEKPIAYIPGGENDYAVYKNPYSLVNFDTDVRAISDSEGNIYVAQIDGGFNHGAMGNELFPQLEKWTNGNTGIYTHPKEYALLMRMGSTNKFGLSDSSLDYSWGNEEQKQDVRNLLQRAEEKNPQYGFYEYYYNNESVSKTNIMKENIKDQIINLLSESLMEKKYIAEIVEIENHVDEIIESVIKKSKEILVEGVAERYITPNDIKLYGTLKSNGYESIIEVYVYPDKTNDSIRSKFEFVSSIIIPKSNSAIYGTFRQQPKGYNDEDLINIEINLKYDNINAWVQAQKNITTVIKNEFKKQLADKLNANPDKLNEIIEGVINKSRQRLFNMPNPDVEQERQADAALPKGDDPNMGEYVGFIPVENAKIYLNPRSLWKFEADVRALSDLQGNLYVATTDERFAHNEISDAVNNMGKYHIGDAVQWYRYKDYPVFVLSNSNHITGEILENARHAAIQKNPRFGFYTEEYGEYDRSFPEEQQEPERDVDDYHHWSSYKDREDDEYMERQQDQENRENDEYMERQEEMDEQSEELLTEGSDDLFKTFFSLIKYNGGQYKTDKQRDYLRRNGDYYYLNKVNYFGDFQGAKAETAYEVFLDDIGIVKIIKWSKNKTKQNLYWERTADSMRISQETKINSDFSKALSDDMHAREEEHQRILESIVQKVREAQGNTATFNIDSLESQINQFIITDRDTFETTVNMTEFNNQYNQIKEYVENNPIIGYLLVLFDEINEYFKLYPRGFQRWNPKFYVRGGNYTPEFQSLEAKKAYLDSLPKPDVQQPIKEDLQLSVEDLQPIMDNDILQEGKPRILQIIDDYEIAAKKANEYAFSVMQPDNNSRWNGTFNNAISPDANVRYQEYMKNISKFDDMRGEAIELQNTAQEFADEIKKEYQWVIKATRGKGMKKYASLNDMIKFFRNKI